MKLLFVLPEWGPVAGGIATYYRHLVPALRQLGHEVTVVVASPFTVGQRAPAEPGLRWVGQSAFQARRGQWSHLAPFGRLADHLAAAWAAHDECAAESWDVVECCDWGLTFLPWLQSGARVVIRFHASLGQVARFEQLPGDGAFQTLVALLEQWGMDRADGLATYSRANAAEWQQRLGRPVAVSVPALGPVAQATGGEAWGLGCGRIQSWKGLDTLCAALAVHRGTTIRWFGADRPMRHARRRVSTSQVLRRQYPTVWGRQLLVRPSLPPEALASQRDRAGFAIVPSAWDVFNFTAAEAMAAGLVTVVSDGAGASEWFEDGRNGLVFEAGDSAALADSLARLASLSGRQRARLGAAGRDTAMAQWRPECAARAHQDHYRTVAAQAPRSPASGLDEILGNAAEDNLGSLLAAMAGRDLLKALLARVAGRWTR